MGRRGILAIKGMPLKFLCNEGFMAGAEMKVYLPLSVLGVVAKVKVRLTPAAPIPDKMATDKGTPAQNDLNAKFLGRNDPSLIVGVAQDIT
jgi:hypothetical protein